MAAPRGPSRVADGLLDAVGLPIRNSAAVFESLSGAKSPELLTLFL
jgi:hypothetical protein